MPPVKTNTPPADEFGVVVSQLVTLQFCMMVFEPTTTPAAVTTVPVDLPLVIRITSYNVCYTKLLRAKNEPKVVEQLLVQLNKGWKGNLPQGRN